MNDLAIFALVGWYHVTCLAVGGFLNRKKWDGWLGGAFAGNAFAVASLLIAGLIAVTLHVLKV